MKDTICKELLGMVLELNLADQGPGQQPFSAHVILNRLILDDEGNVCLSSPGNLQDTLNKIDKIKSELDLLANECVLRTAHGIAFGQAAFRLVGPIGDGSVSNRSDEATGNAQTSSLLKFKRPSRDNKQS